MATANKHKQRSSRSYRQRENFGRFFAANVQKIRARKMFKQIKGEKEEE